MLPATPSNSGEAALHSSRVNMKGEYDIRPRNQWSAVARTSKTTGTHNPGLARRIAVRATASTAHGGHEDLTAWT